VIGFEQELSGGSIRSYPDRHWVNPLNNIIPRAPQNAVGISWKYLAAGNLDLDARTDLPDESAIAACVVYVDLNSVRAGIAATPEARDFTSAQERIADLKAADEVSTADAKDARIEHGESAGWLAPVELEPKR